MYTERLIQLRKGPMIKIQEGIYNVGTLRNEGFREDMENDVVRVEQASFYIAPHTVTNQEFKAFVDATGYISDAEKYQSSYVFFKQIKDTVNQATVDRLEWWREVEGALWKHPFGPNSSIENIMDHPVVHVSYNDCLAYCKWKGVRLPTEIEWEIAARGGLENKKYVWGDEEPDPDRCNIWFGNFPQEHIREIGPMANDAFEPNGYGLYHMAGNVWEWCLNPGRIPLQEVLDHKDLWLQEDKLIREEWFAMRGGSFLCHDSYCNRYRVSARNANSRTSSASNVGFRVVKD